MSSSSQEIINGFDLNEPKVYVPWGINVRQLKEIFKECELKEVTKTYFTTPCESLINLKCFIGFHFNNSEKLNFLEFFIADSDIEKQYDIVQNNIESCFGPPTTKNLGSEGYFSCTWKVGRIEITHSVYERFGLEHHFHIRNKI